MLDTIGKPLMRKQCAPIHNVLNYSERVIEWVFAAAQVEIVQLNDIEEQASKTRGNCCFFH
jgi:hypothetical protein